jgi:endonuclease YncB( thermonuclease family)
VTVAKKAIDQTRSGLTVGYAGLGLYGDAPGSPRRQVHDGDTITVRAASVDPEDITGNFGVRFLGVDAPEISFPLPGESGFTALSDARWAEFLGDPFADHHGRFDPPLRSGLIEYLESRVGEGAAENHRKHAEAAEDALEEEVAKDLEALDKTPEAFRFFLVFAYEVMDRYGRFLCYINRLQPNPNEPEPRPRSYNERLLAAGMVNPYFIWPNVDPFRTAGSLVEAVVPPGGAAALASGHNALSEARASVRDARDELTGVFDGEDPLRLQPFEVRFLSRREPPNRWVIDLGKDDDVLIQPQEYHTLPNIEDRLFVPEEHVPLFVEKGWRRQAFPGDH